MHLVKSILLLLLILIIVLFTAQNMEMVSINFLNWHLEMPLSISSVLIYVIGAVSGGIMFTTIKSLSSKTNDKEKN
jgi:uncharacterized integral membrane protein